MIVLQVLEQQQKQQALLQQHFQRQQEEHMEQQRKQQQQLQQQQQKHQEYMNDRKSHVRSENNGDEKENVRPKVHMKAWATPSPHPPASTPPVSSTQQSFVTHASPYSGKSTHTNVTVTTYDAPVSGVSNYSATNVTNTATVQTTAVSQLVQSVPSQQQIPQSKTVKQETNATLLNAQNGSQTEQTGAQTATDKNVSFLETVTNNLDQGQNESRNLTLARGNTDSIVQYGETQAKSVSEKTNKEKPVIETKTQNSHKNVASSPKVPSYQGYYVNSYAERYNSSKVPYATETTETTNVSKANENSAKRTVGFVVDDKANASIAKGTLAFIDGQLTILPDGPGTEEGADTADTDSVSTLCEEREPEPKGRYYILSFVNYNKSANFLMCYLFTTFMKQIATEVLHWVYSFD